MAKKRPLLRAFFLPGVVECTIAFHPDHTDGTMGSRQENQKKRLELPTMHIERPAVSRGQQERHKHVSECDAGNR